jgi:hypothetical protein
MCPHGFHHPNMSYLHITFIITRSRKRIRAFEEVDNDSHGEERLQRYSMSLPNKEHCQSAGKLVVSSSRLQMTPTTYFMQTLD